MKNEYIRRGMLAGNSEIPIDLIPSLPGTTLFNSNLECENLLGEEQSAQMIIKTELGTDVVTFSQIDASHIKSRIAVPTIQINGNSVPKYKAEIIQSVLVIQSPYTKTLEIVPVVNDTVSNAAKAFGFFISPDPRAVSRVGEISSAPGIGQTSQHNLATYITRFEDKTSESANRAIDSVAKNAEDLHLRLESYETKRSDLSLLKLQGSIETELNSAGSKPIAFYVDESGKVKTFISNHLSLTTPIQTTDQQEYATFKDAYNAQNAQTTFRRIAPQFDLQISEGGNSVFANTRSDFLKTKTASNVEKFGVNPIFISRVSLHKVTDTLTNLNNLPDLVSNGQTITPGFVPAAGVFLKGKHINTGNFTVLDANTIKLTTPLAPDIVKFAQADGLIALLSDEFSYGFKITHVILNDILIVQPLRDIEMRVGALIAGNSYPQNLPIGISGSYFIHIGDKAPSSFFSACHLTLGQTISTSSIPSTTVLVANVNDNCVQKVNSRSDHDIRIDLRKANSANTSDISDSLSSALSGNLSNRSAQSKLFTYPYVERLIHTNTDYSYGNNVYSSLIKSMTSRNNTFAHNVITSSSVSPQSIYNAIEFGIFSSDLQLLIGLLISTLFPLQTRSNTYVRPDGTSTTIGTIIDEIDYTSTSSNPVVYVILLMIADFIPKLSQAFGLIAEHDGYLRSQSSQPFSRYDIGKDFVLNKNESSSFVVRMVEFVSTNVARFVELRSGLNIEEGSYASIVGLRGCGWSQSYDLSLSERVNYNKDTIDSIKVDTHDLELDEGIVLNNAKVLQAGSSVIVHSGVEINEMNAPGTNLVGILPTFLPFSVPTPVSSILSDRLYPLFLRQGTSPVFAPSNEFFSKSCLYLEASLNSYNISGFYEIFEAFPIISNNRAYIGFKIGELVGKSLYQRARLGNTQLGIYAPNNDITKVVNKYEFDISDPDIDSVAPIFCRVHGVLKDADYLSVKGDIKVDDLSINIVDDGYPSVSEPKISINSSIRNNAVFVSIPDAYVETEQLPQPFLKINDLSNEKANIAFTGDDILTNLDYPRKRTNSSTISINKRDTSDSSAIAVTRGVDYAVDPALISVRDTTRPTQTSSDEFGRENTLALSSVGNASVSGLFRVESDVRDTAGAITNYKGTGVNLIGGVDSHLNPTTSAHSTIKNAIYTGNTSHVTYGDKAVEPHTQYPKYLGEAHVISKKGGPIQLINSVVIGPFAQYHNLSITFDTMPKPADVGRAVLIIYTDGSTLLGHVTGINGTQAICRFLGDIRLSEIEDASMLGREWNANFGTVKVSDKIDILEKGSNDVIGSIYAENGEVKIPGYRGVRSDILEAHIYIEKSRETGGDPSFSTEYSMPETNSVIPGYTESGVETRVSYIGDEPDLLENLYDLVIGVDGGYAFNKTAQSYEYLNSILFPQFVPPNSWVVLSVDERIEPIDIGLPNFVQSPLASSLVSCSVSKQPFIQEQRSHDFCFLSELSDKTFEKSDAIYGNDSGSVIGYINIPYPAQSPDAHPQYGKRIKIYALFNKRGISEEYVSKRKFYVIGGMSAGNIAQHNLIYALRPDRWWVNTCVNCVLGRIRVPELRSIEAIESFSENFNLPVQRFSTKDNTIFKANSKMHVDNILKTQVDPKVPVDPTVPVGDTNNGLAYPAMSAVLNRRDLEGYIPASSYNTFTRSSGVDGLSTSFPTMDCSTRDQVLALNILSATNDTGHLPMLMKMGFLDILNKVPVDPDTCIFPTNNLIAKNEIIKSLLRDEWFYDELDDEYATPAIVMTIRVHVIFPS